MAYTYVENNTCGWEIEYGRLSYYSVQRFSLLIFLLIERIQDLFLALSVG